MLRTENHLHDMSPAAVIELLRRHAEHPSAFLATNHATKHFTVPGIDGLIAYRFAGRRYVVMVAGLMAPRVQRRALLDHFLEWAGAQRCRVIAVQFFREDAEQLESSGFRVNQIGASYSVSLDRFQMAGTSFMKLRNKISRARRLGVIVQELGVELESTPAVQRALKEIDASWLKSKGSHVKELTFLIGEVGDLDQLDRSVRRLFVAMHEGQPIGYILYTASFGVHRGWMHDLTRRVAQAPPGVMELVNLTAIERFKSEQVSMLHLGFTPLTALDEAHELKDSCSRAAARVFHLLAKHGNFIYPAETQVQYKLKWAPDLIQPEYIAFQRGFNFSGLWAFLRLTQAL